MATIEFLASFVEVDNMSIEIANSMIRRFVFRRVQTNYLYLADAIALWVLAQEAISNRDWESKPKDAKPSQATHPAKGHERPGGRARAFVHKLSKLREYRNERGPDFKHIMAKYHEECLKPHLDLLTECEEQGQRVTKAWKHFAMRFAEGMLPRTMMRKGLLRAGGSALFVACTRVTGSNWSEPIRCKCSWMALK